MIVISYYFDFVFHSCYFLLATCYYYYSARGVGIGSIVNQLKSPQQMLLAVSAVASAMGRHQASAESTTGLEELSQSLSEKVSQNVFVQ